jgi:glucose-1-phosphate adenylyltransferase
VHSVLALILGGGQGSRLFPLTHLRSKPAVPIGGKYRLIDVPISNCLHADVRRIYVLTQFNSASLNRHVSQTYRMDLFSSGFVDILAAEQTPESESWFQGTADAVRKARRHFEPHDAEYYLILAGDHLYRMDYRRLLDAHIQQNADITVAARPASAEDATGMGIFTFDHQGRIESFEEKPSAERLAVMQTSVRAHGSISVSHDTPFIASMGIYLFSRSALLSLLAQPGNDFGRQLIPQALTRFRVSAYLHDGYWADVGTIASFFEANIQLTPPDAPFSFYDADRPIYTHPRFLPPSRLIGCTVRNGLVAEGACLERCEVVDSVVGIRSVVRAGAQIRQSVLLGADYFDDQPARSAARPPLGIGRDVVLERVIVDKNARIGDGARLVNGAGVTHHDGAGYFIRNGIIVVPKDSTIAAGFEV